jgi:hypothetical protein
MRKILLVLSFLIPSLPGSVFLLCAQDLRIDVGLNMGASRLHHNVNFRSTPLNDLYEFVRIPFKNRNIPYEWEDFEKDYKLKSTIFQPRYGINAQFLYRNWPLFIQLEAISSSSSYQKMSYGGIGGFRYALHDADSAFTFAFLGGYKFVLDQGWGDETLVNSFGAGADEVKNFFRDSPVSLGRNRGSLATLRFDAQRALNESRTVHVGIHLFAEADLTGRTQRLAGGRMNAYGGFLFARFMVLGKVARWRPAPLAAPTMKKG